MADWQNKVAVITGASRGIGAGLATHCAELGMQVVAAATNLDKLAELEHSIQSNGGSVLTVQTDVADPESVQALADLVFERFGKVHLLFNNAGVMVDGKSWERSHEDWRWSYEVNVMGVVSGIRSFLPRMLEQGEPGRVVNTASCGGLISTLSYMGLYQSTKAAVIAITEALYQELALEEAPVSVSLLCPGDVASEIYVRPRDRGSDADVGDSELAMRHTVATMVAKGMSAAEYAERVLRAIEADKFWVITHEDFKPMLTVRSQSVLNETNPLSMAEVIQQGGVGKFAALDIPI